MIKSVFAPLAVFAAVFTVLPVHATPTRVIETTCQWKGLDGSSTTQACRVFGNSSAGAGTVLHVNWQDGVKTVLQACDRSGKCWITPSGKRIQVYGEYEFDRISLPRVVRIDGLGTIKINYQNYSIFNHYE